MSRMGNDCVRAGRMGERNVFALMILPTVQNKQNDKRE